MRASSTYRYSRLADPVPHTSTSPAPLRRASTHFLISAGITWDTLGWNLSPGPYRFVGMRKAKRCPYCAALTWACTSMRLLGDPVRRVGLLRVAVPQVVLGERHGRELGVRAHRAEQHGLADAGGAGRLDHVRAHQQVGEVQRRRLGLVVADPPDPRGEVDDLRWAVVGDHVGGGGGLGEVEVGTADDDGVGSGRAATRRRPAARGTRHRRSRRRVDRSRSRSPGTSAAVYESAPSPHLGKIRVIGIVGRIRVRRRHGSSPMAA